MVPETNLLLSRPEMGQTLTIDTTPFAMPETATTGATTSVEIPNIVLDFSTAEAVLDRDGDDLVFIFTEGTTVTITVNGTSFMAEVGKNGLGEFISNAKNGSAFALNADGTFIYTRPTANVTHADANDYTINVTIKNADGSSEGSTFIW